MVSPSSITNLAYYRVHLATAKEDDFLALHEQFVQWLANLKESSLDQLEQQNYLAQHQEFFTTCQRRYLTLKERQEVNLLIEKSQRVNMVGDSLISRFGINAYERVRDLSQMVDFSACQRCIMVGCGALPATLFYLYDRYPTLEYIGIDIDPVALTTAQEAMDSLGIEKIRLVEADGSQFDYAETDLVYIANQVSPKSLVLEHIAATVEQTVQLVMRDPTRRGKLLADCGRDVLPRQFSLVQKGEESQSFLSVDLLLRLQP